MDLSERQGQFIKKSAEEGGLIAKFRNMLNRRTSLDKFIFGDDAPEFGSQEPEYRTYNNLGATIGSDYKAYNPLGNADDRARDAIARGMAGTGGAEPMMRLLSKTAPDDYAMYVNKNPFGGYAANIMTFTDDGKGGVVRDSWGRALRNTININGLDEQSARALAAAMEDKDLGLRKALQDSWNARDLSEELSSKNAVKEVMWKGRLEPYDFVIHDAIESAKKKMKSEQEVADDVDFHSRAAHGGSPYDAHANKFNSKAAIPYIKAQKGLRREVLRGLVGDEAYAELQKGHGLALGPTQDKLTAFLLGDEDYDKSKGLSKSLLRQLKGRKLSSIAKLTGAAGLASAVGANIAPFVGEESDTADILRNGIATTALMAPSTIEAVRKGKDAVKDWNVNQDRIARWTDVGSGLDQYSKRELKSLLKGVKPRGGMPAALMGAGVSGLSFLPFLTKGLRGQDKAEEVKMPSALGGGSIPSAVGSSAAPKPTSPSTAPKPTSPSTAPKPTSPSVAAPLDKKASVYGALAALYGRI